MVKTILLTGATSGIGSALAKALSSISDYNLILMGRSQEKLDALNLPNAKSFSVDLQDQDALNETIGKILSNYEIDILINNAGVGVPTNLSDGSVLEKYSLMMDTNVKAVVQLTAPILAQMKTADSGLIINVSSEAGLSSNPVAPLYCASKFALEAYSDGLRQQLKGENSKIRVSVLRPGPIATNYWGERQVPKEKFLTAQEVADAIIYLISVPQTVNIKSLDLESKR